MKNIYDERKEENLLFVLENDKDNDISRTDLIKCAVIVHLYYLDTIEKYMHYINLIPEGIITYIYSSNNEVLDRVKKISRKKDIVCILKENKGRDISTLLVAASNVISRYEVICFIHDKKKNADYLKQDAEYWIYNLWENMLSSEKYIKSVIELFKNNLSLGVLVPPEPYGEYNSHWYGNTWRDNYVNTKKLADALELQADITEGKEVFTLGTVFWVRTVALKKLTDREWEYEDFPEEPLPLDGTISHAIERIIGYVAQDAGYKTGTVMTARYAAGLLLEVQEDMRMMFAQLEKRTHIYNMYQINNLDQREREIDKICTKYPNIYIYGAGNYGRNLYQILKDRNKKCQGYMVSTGRRRNETIDGLKVWEIQEIVPDKQTGILIGVSYEYRNEIENLLDESGFENYFFGY